MTKTLVDSIDPRVNTTRNQQEEIQETTSSIAKKEDVKKKTSQGLPGIFPKDILETTSLTTNSDPLLRSESTSSPRDFLLSPQKLPKGSRKLHLKLARASSKDFPMLGNPLLQENKDPALLFLELYERQQNSDLAEKLSEQEKMFTQRIEDCFLIKKEFSSLTPQKKGHYHISKELMEKITSIDPEIFEKKYSFDEKLQAYVLTEKEFLCLKQLIEEQPSFLLQQANSASYKLYPHLQKVLWFATVASESIKRKQRGDETMTRNQKV